MTVPVIKAICRRIEARMGGGKNAALAAGVSAGVWSHYVSEEHPETTIPVHRLLAVASLEERRAFAELLNGEDAASAADLMTEAQETTESAAELQGLVRKATADGVVTELESRRIRAKALEVKAQADDVLRVVGS